jgi:carbon-monoxide dehydrogenase catalytic subunit
MGSRKERIMEFIQKKTVDPAVEHFLRKAMDQEIELVWDRFEGQLPECGFCESGLSCRDCLQGPCISHPFKDQSKLGVCGKDKDTLAVQSLLRLVLKGTMSFLGQLSDFACGVEADTTLAKEKEATEQLIGEVKNLYERGSSGILEDFPGTFVDSWSAAGIRPEGIAKDLFKASQKLEGGISSVEETLLWTFKSSLLGCMASKLQGKLKTAVFGNIDPTELQLNLGVLQTETPNILVYGHVSPLLKHKIAAAAQKSNVSVMGVCTDPLIPPYRFSPATTYGSQEIPLMTGAVDLIVTGDQFVNPSLKSMAKEYKVSLVLADGLKQDKDPDTFARQIVEQASKSFDNRADLSRDIPDVKETAILGFSAENLDVERIVQAVADGKIKGIAILSGSNNIKYTQDNVLATMARQFLAKDILCISTGEASVCLAKYGLLNPQRLEDHCGKGLTASLSSLGENIPPVVDWAGTDFLCALAGARQKSLKDYPIVAYFPEANRSLEVAEALWTVAMGVSTYFWPCLPLTGSPKVKIALSELCEKMFGSKLHVVTEKMDPRAKAELFLRVIEKPEALSGKPW